jgi:general L-amino acid transport system permease protein
MAVQTETAAVRRESPAMRWAKENLFSSWYNSLLTLIFGVLFLWGGFTLLRWVFFRAEWEIVRVNLTLFMVGRFPREELARIWVSNYLIAGAIGVMAGAAAASAAAAAKEAGLPFTQSTPRDWLQRFWPILLLVAILLQFSRTWTPTFLTLAMIAAGVAGRYVGLHLPDAVRRWAWLIVTVMLIGSYATLAWFGGVKWDDWGGLHLTIFITIAGIVLAFPLGLLLALGRRSSLPLVRLLSVAYIEFIRGVPLITLLLMGIFALGFLLPPGVDPSDVTRLIVAITLFTAAYVAENVRGGLQAVPKGQTEAGQALGLAPWKVMRLIVLPQALRAVIPAMVGQFISLFKDTSLLVVVGIVELLQVSSIANNQPEFLGQGLVDVTLPFVALIYWVGSYTMSRESRRLEKKLGVGER